MASFVQRLRMANMFPIHSDLGNAQVPVDNNDDMYDVINAGKNLFDYANRNRGIEEVGNSVRNAPQKIARPTFGGMVGDVSNPGADILARSRNSAEQTYANNNEELLRGRIGPQPGSEDVMGRDESHLDRYMKRKNAESTINANIADRELARTDRNTNERLDRESREKIAKDNIAGRVSLQDDKQLEKAALDKEKSDSASKLKELNRKAIKDRAQAALDELNRLMDEKTDTLTERGSNAFGGINNMISGLPWSTDSYDASTTRKRLKDLLTLDLIAEMKNQSKTGATGFGQMNLRELGVLEGGASRLEGKLSDVDAPGALKDVRKHLRDILMDETPNQNDFEVLFDPNNVPRRVPKNQVEEFLKRGGRR